MMTKAHALLSASKAAQWMSCPGSIAMGKNIPDSWSTFAEEGTAAHELASWCLETGREPKEYLGQMIRIINGKYRSPSDMIDFKDVIQTDNSYEVTTDMVGHIESYVQVVEDFTPVGAKRFIEERVDFSKAIGVKDSFGTSDVIIIHNDEICVVDLKYGMGVEVSAFENPQLMLYALGALERYRFVYDFTKVRMVIHQPRIQNLSEWDCSVDELMAFGEKAKKAAIEATTPHGAAMLNPSDKACRFCKAKGTCPALAKEAMRSVTEDFVNLDDEQAMVKSTDAAIARLPASTPARLSVAMKAVDLVETWIKGVREAVYLNLANGNDIPDFKLVRGKQGNRKWTSEKDAEKALKAMKLKSDQMYNKKLISPTDADKLLSKLVPEKWEELQIHISRSEGSLSVAPANDKRPAEGVEKIEFENLTEATE